MPAAINFTAELNEDDPDNRGVMLSWNDGTGGENSIEGYLIVRKAGTAPISIWDGKMQREIIRGQSAEDWDVDSDAEYPRGNRVYYSIFAYGPEWDNVNDDDSSIINTQNYNFVGSVSTSVGVIVFIHLTVAEDKYMVEQDGFWTNDSILSVLTDNNPTRSVAGIIFDLSNTPTENIIRAELILTKYNFSIDGTNVNMDISRWASDWSPVSDWNTLDTILNHNLISNVQVPCEDKGVVNVEVTGDYKDWVINNEINYGFRLRCNESPGVSIIMPFCASEQGANGPKLRFWYFNE